MPSSYWCGLLRCHSKSLPYRKLVSKAALLPVPTQTLLKDAKDFKVIGKPAHRLDSFDKGNGSAIFGIDVKVPDMKVATVAAYPYLVGS